MIGRTQALLLSSVLGAASLSAQADAEAPKARNFRFDDYRTVIQLDMKAVRDTGIWDELGGSMLKLAIAQVEQQLGSPLDAIDVVTTVRARPSGDAIGGRFAEVTTIEGNAELGLPEEVARQYEPSKVGAYTVYVDSWDDGGLCRVTPKLQVYAPRELLEHTLAGHVQNGLPSSDVMAFTAGRKNVLFHTVLDLAVDDFPRQWLLEVLEGVEWPEGDAPTFAFLVGQAVGDEFDPHIQLELVLRHATPSAGLDVTVAAVDRALAKLAEVPEARMLVPLLKKIERERDGPDAIWRVDVGRARDAAGLIGMLAPMMLVARTVEQVQALPVQVEEVEEPAEEEQQGGGGG